MTATYSSSSSSSSARRPGGALPAGTSARITLVAIVVYLAVDVLLAFLRPHYSLVDNAESDYGNGPWFWVMDLNFLLRCVLSLALAGALYQTLRPRRLSRIGLTLLVVWAIASGLLAFFTDDPAGTPQHGSGLVHDVLAVIAFVSVAIGTLLLSIAVWTEPAWRPFRVVLLVVSIAGILAYVPLTRATAASNGVGLYERIYLGLELLWFVIAAVAVLTTTRVTDQANRAGS